MPHRLSKQQGFTLIEVMCATTILIIGMLGVYGSETASSRNYTNSRQLFMASSLAANTVEMLKVMDPTMVQTLKTSGFNRSFDTSGTAAEGNGAQRTVFYRLSIGPAPTVSSSAFKVTVTWPDATQPGQSASIQLVGTPL